MVKEKKGNGDPPKQITFHYLKSTQFRVIHIDGAIGGITPAGFIHISMFNERSAIPREQTHSVKKDGTLGDPIDTVSRNGVVREMEVDAIMNLSTAKILRDWLDRNIKKLEQHIPQKG